MNKKEKTMIIDKEFETTTDEFIIDFYYLYTLENNLKIKLAFNESNFPYLLGLHKFKIVSKYRKQSDIIEAIKFLKISL